MCSLVKVGISVVLAMAVQSQSAMGQCNEWTPGPLPVTSPQGFVASIASHGSSVYIGGTFAYPTTGGTVNNIARWGGGAEVGPLVANVHPGGEGINDSVYAVLARQEGSFPNTVTRVYVGGSFSMAGNTSVNRVARYTQQTSGIGGDTSWGGTGSGFNDDVYALALHNNEVYAGGTFTASGVTQCHRIARWNGTSWQPVGTPLGDFIYKLISHGGFLYAAGEFTVSGVDYPLARWNGTSWQYLTGFTAIEGQPFISALAIHNGLLIVGGYFQRVIGGQTVNCIAAFDGTNWINVGSADSAIDIVTAIASHDGNLYIAGEFFSVSGQRASGLAMRDSATSTWRAVGEGIPLGSAVYALHSVGHRLHVVGTFISPNGVPFIASPGWWIWNTDCPCPSDMVTSATLQPPPDGLVDGADLAYLIGEWGTNPGSPADIVTSATLQPPPDGVVNGADLAVLIGAWGVCD